jgi:adenylylsulfate kinase
MKTQNSKLQTPNTIYHNVTVTRERRNQLNDHKSVVIWITGLSGSGKSTLTHSVEEELHKLNCRTFVLDGDNVRHGLSSNLTFSDDDRKENIRRIGESAKLMMEACVISMTTFNKSLIYYSIKTALASKYKLDIFR